MTFLFIKIIPKYVNTNPSAKKPIDSNTKYVLSLQFYDTLHIEYSAIIIPHINKLIIPVNSKTSDDKKLRYPVKKIRPIFY